MFQNENIGVAMPPSVYFPSRKNSERLPDVILVRTDSESAVFISYHSLGTFSSSLELSADIVEKAGEKRILDENSCRSTLAARIKTYSNLKKGWDGHKANSIDVECIDNANKIISELPYSVVKNIKLTDVFPTPNGTLMFEVGNEDQYFIIDVGNTTVLYYYRFDDNLEGIDEPVLFTDEALGEISELFVDFNNQKHIS